jgi:hypothetical protein
MVLVTAEENREFNRDCFTRGALANHLKKEGLFEFKKIADNRLDDELKSYIKRPDVVMINSGSDELETMFNEIKGPKQEKKPGEDDGVLYKQLVEEACDYVNADIPLE